MKRDGQRRTDARGKTWCYCKHYKRRHNVHIDFDLWGISPPRREVLKRQTAELAEMPALNNPRPDRAS